MNEETTKKRQKRKKRASIVAGVIVIGALLFVIAPVLFVLFLDLPIEVVGMILFYMLPFFAILVGVVLALRQRIKEVNSGEEEDARKY